MDLRELRKEKGWSQGDLSNLSIQTVKDVGRKRCSAGSNLWLSDSSNPPAFLSVIGRFIVLRMDM